MASQKPLFFSLLSLLLLLCMYTAQAQRGFIQYAYAKNEFRILNVDPPVSSPKSSKPAVWGNYFWEFGDGHYSFDSVAVHNFPRPDLYEVKVFLTPHYSFSKPVSYSRKFSVNAPQGPPPVYSLGGRRVSMESTGGDYLVPGHEMQFVVHYQAPPDRAVEEGYVLLFYNNRRETNRFKIKFDPLRFLEERLYYREEAMGDDFFSLPRSGLPPAGLAAANELFNQHNDVRIFKVQSLKAGQERRLFCTIASDQRLENHQDKDRELSVTAFWLPLGGSFDEKKDRYVHKMEVLEVHDPNRIKVRKRTAYYLPGQPVAVSGGFPSFSISGQEGIGSHILEIEAEDDCGNIASLAVPLEVFDCQAPAPVCLNGLTVELMPGMPCTDADGDIDEGFATLNASDFVTGSLTDCSGLVTLSINRAGEAPDPLQSSLVVTFDDPDTLMLEVYVWDGAYNPTSVQPGGAMGGPNYEYCEITVLLADNMLKLCGTPGWINDRNGEPVEFVAVSLTGHSVDLQNTQVDGFYEFCPVDEGFDYTVTPSRNDDPLNGVDNLDLALLADHITGVAPLTDPYQLIAADVNNSGNITTADYFELQQLILNIVPVFSNNTSWRFVPACYIFPNPSNPWSPWFPESLNYNNLQTPVAPDGFIGIKIGDLNGDAMPNSQAAVSYDIAHALEIPVPGPILRASREDEVQFRSEERSRPRGFDEEPLPSSFSARRAGSMDGRFYLEQNAPNPWSDRTSIGFFLPEAGAVRLTVRDVRGRILQETRAVFDEGYHQLEVAGANLGTASGLLFYTLKTNRSMETRKMIRLSSITQWRLSLAN